MLDRHDYDVAFYQQRQTTKQRADGEAVVARTSPQRRPYARIGELSRPATSTSVPVATRRSVGGWMEVGVFPADPRAIAAAEVLGVSLKLRPLIAMPVPLVICAAKMLIGGCSGGSAREVSANDDVQPRARKLARQSRWKEPLSRLALLPWPFEPSSERHSQG